MGLGCSAGAGWVAEAEGLVFRVQDLSRLWHVQMRARAPAAHLPSALCITTASLHESYMYQCPADQQPQPLAS